jgi:hypothetical protein
MPNRVRVLWAAIVLATVLPGAGAGLIQSSAQGQTPQASATTTATLSGVVVDNGGGNVPGATVVLSRVDTGEKMPAQVTNANGAYSFPGLAPGKYTVTISLQGFKTTKVELTIAAGSNNALSTKLEVGAVSEVVNVTAGTDLVRTDTPTVTQTVNGTFIQTLPRSDRNAQATIVFLPGVTAAGGAGGGGGGRGNTTIAGLPATQYNVTIDGVATQVRPRLDAIEEVTLRSAGVGGETYARFIPNPFLSATDNPLSTFGADVDTASFSNIRRYLSGGQLPPAAAVRTEELVNYFRFPYAAPRNGQPIALTTEIGDCPWAPTHKLALIGARAAAPAQREITGRNIVLLIDVSGSMAPPSRLPLIKTALGLFAGHAAAGRHARDRDVCRIERRGAAGNTGAPARHDSERHRGAHRRRIDERRGGPGARVRHRATGLCEGRRQPRHPRH